MGRRTVSLLILPSLKVEDLSFLSPGFMIPILGHPHQINSPIGRLCEPLLMTDIDVDCEMAASSGYSY